MKAANSNRVTRSASRTEWVELELMRVRTGVSQRELNQAWVDALYKDFKLEKFKLPVVNKVGQWYWIVDGQHSVEALKRWLGDWKGQSVECVVYRGLGEEQEADLFLDLNRVKAVGSFDKFEKSLRAGREEATNIDAIVRLKGLRVSRQRGEGSISCVAALAVVYRMGPDCLARALEIANSSFGDPGLDQEILKGLGHVASRYNGQLDDKRVINALRTLRGGVGQLASRAERIRQQVGIQKSQAFAAAVVEAYNRQKGKKLVGYLKAEA